MKAFFYFNRSVYAVILFLFLFTVACDEQKPSDAAIQHPDSLSVRKMDADSNSEMPMEIPKDSTAKMPNPYDPESKAPPIK